MAEKETNVQKINTTELRLLPLFSLSSLERARGLFLSLSECARENDIDVKKLESSRFFLFFFFFCSRCF